MRAVITVTGKAVSYTHLVEVAIYALDLRVILVHTLDQNRDGIIQLCADVMAAMAGNNFKAAVAAGAAEDGFTDTVILDGLK